MGYNHSDRIIRMAKEKCSLKGGESITEEEMRQDIRTVEQIVDDMDLFDNGSHIVYVSGNYKGEDEVGKLLHDFGCKKSKDMYYSELVKGLRHFKEEGGRRIMCEAVKKYAKQ